jgi:hypothetical protein
MRHYYGLSLDNTLLWLGSVTIDEMADLITELYNEPGSHYRAAYLRDNPPTVNHQDDGKQYEADWLGHTQAAELLRLIYNLLAQYASGGKIDKTGLVGAPHMDDPNQHQMTLSEFAEWVKTAKFASAGLIPGLNHK